MAQRVRKAVLPVAGLGTRFLPATKAMPKEMLTVVDRPLIQYAVEECLAAGIEEFVFVTGRNKGALEDHFDVAYELEATLEQRGKKRGAEADPGRHHQGGQCGLHPPAEAARPRPCGVVRAPLDRPRAVRRAAARRTDDRLADLHRPARRRPREDRRQRRRRDGRAARADQELRHRRGQDRRRTGWPRSPAWSRSPSRRRRPRRWR